MEAENQKKKKREKVKRGPRVEYFKHFLADGGGCVKIKI